MERTISVTWRVLSLKIITGGIRYDSSNKIFGNIDRVVTGCAEGAINKKTLHLSKGRVDDFEL